MFLCNTNPRSLCRNDGFAPHAKLEPTDYEAILAPCLSLFPTPVFLSAAGRRWPSLPRPWTIPSPVRGGWSCWWASRASARPVPLAKPLMLNNEAHKSSGVGAVFRDLLEGTARRHVANIDEKIGAVNRVEAASYAVREGLAPMDNQDSSA